MKNSEDPWYKTTHELNSAAGTMLRFDVPHDVFSTLRIDEGTVLLLDHLPETKPRNILDMGCGYGALGIPVAALHPSARVLMVDRDLLAVEWARRNAQKNEVHNAISRGSLGYREVEKQGFDWILCNVPARIGKEFISHLFTEGMKMLNPCGEIRVVVIRDLAPTLHEISAETGFQIKEVVAGERHSIFTLPHSEVTNQGRPGEIKDLYFRDTVQMEGVFFDRPFDLGGDDPKRLRASLPLMLDALPRERAPASVLCVRGGYGILPVLCGKRWPDSRISVFDRDLLAQEFTLRNLRRQLAESSVSQLGGHFFPAALSEEQEFDLILLEVSSSSGQRVAEAEIKGLRDHLTREGVALIISLDKVGKDWVHPVTGYLGCSIRPLASRDGFTVFSLVRTE